MVLKLRIFGISKVYPLDKLSKLALSLLRLNIILQSLSAISTLAVESQRTFPVSSYLLSTFQANFQK